MPNSTTGQLIRNARLKAAFSQGMVARELGVTNSLVSHWEAGRRMPEDLASVAQALGVPVEELTMVDSPSPPLGRRADFPVPSDLPSVELQEGEGEPWVNLVTIIRFIQTFYGMRISNTRIYEWLFDEGLSPRFPAYRNPLKKNAKGEPTLLFKKSEVRTWFEQVIQPFKPG